MHRIILFICTLVFAVNVVSAQQDSIPVLKVVVVSGVRPSAINETSMNISSLPVAKMKQSGAINISDALAKLPGINQLNTGPAISKPVIRGLYGNRVLAVLSGLKFDNQQWQDEHGLGLTEVGIDRIEVIKGPASLLYGSEAIGGILNIIEEQPNLPGIRSGDINVGLFSNTLGFSADIGIKNATQKRNWSIRGGINSNADYTDGNNNRIVNSRFSGYYLKASLGFSKKNWSSINHFHSSLDNFGFITEDNSNSFPNDGRLSRGMEGPHHEVLLNILSSENKLKLKRSTLDINAGLQSNLRLEDEGGHSISLNMLLSGFLLRGLWTKLLNTNTEFILSNNSQFENNTNLGSRIIIPDANMMETGFAGFVRRKKNGLVLEAGAGFSIRNIHTFLTDGVNTPDKSIAPFNKTLPSVNGAVGLSWYGTSHWNIKFNIATGFRSANLAELSSDGLHEGTLRYEIGDPNLKIEQNINSEISIVFNSEKFRFTTTAFINHFLNYIYLAPTGTQFLGFDVFRYLQFDANLYGSELMIGANLFESPAYGLKWESNFSFVTGKLTTGDHLPFIPPAKLVNELRLENKGGKKIKDLSVFIAGEIHFKQDHPAIFESPTDDYWLLNAGVSGSLQTKNRLLQFTLTGNNLLNENYFDHLSRFKDYGIHNIGRNIVLHFNNPFSFKQKNKNHEKY
jgi:iron complex outermembrane receptor protein